MTVRITEAELARDIHAVLARVQEGDEVIVEENLRPVAVIKTPPRGPGRKLSECIALAKAREQGLGYAPVPDLDFARDVQTAIDSRPEPFHPPAWD
jgi:antitoxin (DNA-binding transcriptional repressor) of toxin-antitoxin stability system